ncbi:hypothetical protein GGTG_01154 [Gaeumannomyces tritici R3-111a-1]|uniref:Uncharacterized protein n=1 Tax=Gaeumannomyces tritici (strain R3-111a-1) TaxID=644352 RepID=J3NIS0_GAET3|nr:hypothetical protein GGTG_01154 [Gaeumannomyces tritici R3-111a-1]EJT81170.1 hypothetical protein GGTG_01154 [Gaeumannomyces tritici R3-111a-1]
MRFSGWAAWREAVGALMVVLDWELLGTAQAGFEKLAMAPVLFAGEKEFEPAGTHARPFAAGHGVGSVLVHWVRLRPALSVWPFSALAGSIPAVGVGR